MDWLNLRLTLSSRGCPELRVCGVEVGTAA